MEHSRENSRQIREDSRTDSQRIHNGFARVRDQVRDRFATDSQRITFVLVRDSGQWSWSGVAPLEEGAVSSHAVGEKLAGSMLNDEP